MSERAEPIIAELIITELTRRHLTIAVAESLTGGLLTAALVAVPGASAVVRGGVIAYDTALKRSLLGVDAALLAAHGAVHPEVARQMAHGVRETLAVDGEPAAVGISSTGVAGPDSQDGQQVGTVFLGFSIEGESSILSLHLEGDREAIRKASVSESLEHLGALLLRE